MKESTQYVTVLIAMFISSTTATVVVYGALGDTVMLPMAKQTGEVREIYVYWTTELGKVLTQNFGAFTYDEHWKGRVSMSKSSFSLIIKNIKEDDFRIFTCTVKRATVEICSKTYILKKVSVEPALPLFAGDPLSLACAVEQPHHDPAPRMRWLNPQKEEISDDVTHKLKLEVKTATFHHHGEWTCVVTANDREARVKTFVTVVDLSPAPSHPHYISNKSRPNIPCSVPSSVTWELLKEKGLRGGRWTFSPSPAQGSPSGAEQKLLTLSLDPPAWHAERGRKLAGADLSKNDLSLRLDRAMEAEGGVYTCALEFEGGVNLTRRVHVEVLQILSSPGPNVVIGQSVNLTCSPGHSSPSDLEMRWTPPRKSSLSPLGPGLHSPFLSFQASEGDSGRWRCDLLRNKTLLSWADITMKMDRAPVDIWLLMTISGAVVIFILLLILTVILIRRHRQRRMAPRRHKRRLCTCPNPKPKGFYRS